jgi:hypothetical protein
MSQREQGSARLLLAVLIVACLAAAAYGIWFRKAVVTQPAPEASRPPSPPAAATALTSSANTLPNVPAGPASASDVSRAPGTARGASHAALSEPAASGDASERRVVSGRVVQTSDYCGGAHPPDELLEALRKEKPFPNKTIYVRAGGVNQPSEPVAKFTTDAEGRFQISLPPGTYCLIEENKKLEMKIPDIMKENQQLPPSQAYQFEGQDCLRKWWNSCDATLTVGKDDVKNVVIKFHQTCRPPCITGGPMPA